MHSNLRKCFVIILLIVAILASSCNRSSKRSSLKTGPTQEVISAKEFKKVMSKCGLRLSQGDDDFEDKTGWVNKAKTAYSYYNDDDGDGDDEEDFIFQVEYLEFKSDSVAEDYFEWIQEYLKERSDEDFDFEVDFEYAWKFTVDFVNEKYHEKIYGIWVQVEEVVIGVLTYEAQIDACRSVVDEIIAELGYGEGDGDLDEYLEEAKKQIRSEAVATATTTTKPNPTTTATFETELITEPEEPSETTKESQMELSDTAEHFESTLYFWGFDVIWYPPEDYGYDNLVAFGIAYSDSAEACYYECIDEQTAENHFEMKYEYLSTSNDTIFLKKGNYTIRVEYDSSYNSLPYGIYIWVDNYVISVYASDEDTLERTISDLGLYAEMVSDMEEPDPADDPTTTTTASGNGATLKDVTAKKVDLSPKAFEAALRAVDPSAADGIFNYGESTSVSDYMVNDYYMGYQDDYSVMYTYYDFQKAEDAKAYFDSYTGYLKDYATSYQVEADWGYVAYQSGDYCYGIYHSDNGVITVVSLDASADCVDKVSGFFEGLCG